MTRAQRKLKSYSEVKFLANSNTLRYRGIQFAEKNSTKGGAFLMLPKNSQGMHLRVKILLRVFCDLIPLNILYS